MLSVWKNPFFYQEFYDVAVDYVLLDLAGNRRERYSSVIWGFTLVSFLEKRSKDGVFHTIVIKFAFK